MSDEFDFTNLKPVVVPVTLFDGTKLALHELSAGEMRDYVNARTARTVFDNGKAVSTKNVGDLDLIIVGLGLKDGTGEKYNAAKLEAIPGPHVEKMANKLRQISGLAGKDPLVAAVKKLFQLPNSPITWDNLVDWVGTVEPLMTDADFTQVRDCFKKEPLGN